MIVSAFRNVKSTSPLAFIKVDDVLTRIAGTGKHIDKVKQYRDTKDKSIKESLPVVTWNGKFRSRSNAGLVSFSDYIYFDSDKIDSNLAKEVLVEEEYIKAVWTSVGGEGVGFLVKSEGLNKSNFKSTYNAIKSDIESKGLIIDSLSDIARCNIASYDPDIYIRDKVVTYEPVSGSSVYRPTLSEQYKLFVNDHTLTACTIAFAHALKAKGDFTEGNRSNFTVSYVGTCNHFGITEHECYMFLIENGCVYEETENKIQYVYKRYANQHGTNPVRI